MPLQFDDFKNNLPLRPDSKVPLAGLESLKKNLEKYFFAEVTIRINHRNKYECNLVIELNCNIDMFETVWHLDNGNWGGFYRNQYSIKDDINALMELNDLWIEIDEFSIFLEDTSIIINKVYEQSIPHHLENIMLALSKNYFHLTRGSTEVPYEIYIPVFEESPNMNTSLKSETSAPKSAKKEYFDYWGLYFESNDDAEIYDFTNLSIIQGDLFMLNEE